MDEYSKQLWKKVCDTIDNIKYKATVHQLDNHSIVSIDLHGLTLNEAFRAFNEHIDQAYQENLINYVTIITGKSGKIFQEFPHWVNHHSKVIRWELQKNGGSFKVYLVKK